MHRPVRANSFRVVMAIAAALLTGVVAGSSVGNAAGHNAAGATRLRSVMLVGNNWAGTASIVDAESWKVLKRGIDLVADKQEELDRIHADPQALAFYLAIQQGPGEGHDQYVDDMFTTSDGRYLAVSRPSFADVAWIDLRAAVDPDADPSQVVVHEEQMDGFRSDHMSLSPDGTRLLVSDSTSRQVIEYSMQTSDITAAIADDSGRTTLRRRTFQSGETPHESNYSRDGASIFHASIGRVYTPGDSQELGPLSLDAAHDAAKGDQWFQIVDNDTFQVTDRWDIGKELEEAGYPRMSPAVRPMAVARDERFVYFQVSFFHGLVEFDTQAPDADPDSTYETGAHENGKSFLEPDHGAVRRVIPLPNRVPDMPREQYVNDSAHHGLSMNDDGTTLCAAGTMDDYVALVDRETMSFRTLDHTNGKAPAGTDGRYAKPYWTTEGPHDTCWVSLSGSDAVVVIDFNTREEVAYLAVGDHPQRIRHGHVPSDVVAGS